MKKINEQQQSHTFITADVCVISDQNGIKRKVTKARKKTNTVNGQQHFYYFRIFIHWCMHHILKCEKKRVNKEKQLVVCVVDVVDLALTNESTSVNSYLLFYTVSVICIWIENTEM